MPIVNVKVYETRINDETVANLIEKITDAVVDCTSEDIRKYVWVIVEGVPRKQWGTAGKSHGEG